MNIVTGRTVHGAHPEAFAQTQQAELVSMHFHGCTAVWGLRRKQEIIQVIAHPIRKGWHEIITDAGMTEGTVIKFLFPAETGGVDDMFSFLLVRVFQMKSNMPGSRSVTSFTIHPEHHLFPVKSFIAVSWLAALEIRSVTFQAACRNATIKEYLIRGIAWAIAPAIGRVRDMKPGVEKARCPARINMFVPGVPNRELCPSVSYQLQIQLQMHVETNPLATSP